MKKHHGHEHHMMSHSKHHSKRHHSMHDGHHSMHHGHESGHHSIHHGHESGHGLYKNETEHPHQNPQGHPEHGHGAEDFKGMAMDIAYGQAGKAGMHADDARLRAQFKNYHWADSPAREAPGAY